MASQFSIAEGRKWQLPFLTIWIGQAFSLLGSQLVQFALIWYLTVSTESATVLTTASLVGLLPNIFLSPFIGTWVDRLNRRAVMMIADASIAFFTAVLAILFCFDQIAIWHIYVVLFLRAVGSSFHGTAMQASTSLMIPKENLTRIQAINRTVDGGLSIFSAPLGALLFSVVPMQAILSIDVVTAILAIAPLAMIAIPQPARAEVLQVTFFQDFVEGLSYLLSWKGLSIMLLLGALVNFLISPAFALLPILVRNHLGGDAAEMAWMESALGIGIVLGGFILSVWGGFKRQMYTAMLGLSGFGLAGIVIGVIPPMGLYIGIAAMLLLGISFTINSSPLFGMLQAIITPEKQGRVFTLVGSVANGVSPIGLLIAGPVADQFGTQFWFVLFGISCIILAIVQMSVPIIRNVEDGPVVEQIT